MTTSGFPSISGSIPTGLDPRLPSYEDSVLSSFASSRTLAIAPEMTNWEALLVRRERLRRIIAMTDEVVQLAAEGTRELAIAIQGSLDDDEADAEGDLAIDEELEDAPMGDSCGEDFDYDNNLS